MKIPEIGKDVIIEVWKSEFSSLEIHELNNAAGFKTACEAFARKREEKRILSQLAEIFSQFESDSLATKQVAAERFANLQTSPEDNFTIPTEIEAHYILSRISFAPSDIVSRNFGLTVKIENETILLRLDAGAIRASNKELFQKYISRKQEQIKNEQIDKLLRTKSEIFFGNLEKEKQHPRLPEAVYQDRNGKERKRQ